MSDKNIVFDVRENHQESAMQEVQLDSLVSGNQEEPEVDTLQDTLQTGTNANVYVSRRNFIHQLMDVALFMANVSQLKAILSLPTTGGYFYALFVLILLSISLQVTFTVCMIVIWSIEKQLEEHQKQLAEQHIQVEQCRRMITEFPGDKARKRRTERLDMFCNVLVFLIIVSNIFIASFGIEGNGQSPMVFNQVSNGSEVN